MSEPYWVPLGAYAPQDAGAEVAYAEATGSQSITVTTEAGAQIVAAAPAFMADGSSSYLVEFFCPAAQPPGGSGSYMNIWLFLDGVSQGVIATVQNNGASGYQMAVRSTRKVTPAAGSRVYSVRAMVGAGTGVLNFGAGGAGVNVPGFIRISKIPTAVAALGGMVPPTAIGTSLPASPVDGQEFILTDSLTAPTYTWHLRYMAAKASNKWVFVGGVPLLSEILAQENAVGNVYVDAATVGPSVTVPVAGEYLVDFGMFSSSSGNVGIRYVAPKFGAAATLDADSASSTDSGASAVSGFSGRVLRRTIAASTLVKLQYKHSANQTVQAAQRFLVVTPIAVGG